MGDSHKEMEIDDIMDDDDDDDQQHSSNESNDTLTSEGEQPLINASSLSSSSASSSSSLPSNKRKKSLAFDLDDEDDSDPEREQDLADATESEATVSLFRRSSNDSTPIAISSSTSSSSTPSSTPSSSKEIPIGASSSSSSSNLSSSAPSSVQFLSNSNREKQRRKSKDHSMSPLLLNSSHGKTSKTSLFAHKVRATTTRFIRDEGGDLSVQMNNFLQSGAIDETGRLARLLKCIQQEIICPPVMDLRYSIYQQFPYKDVKGTWMVKIQIFYDDPVTGNSDSPHGSSSSVPASSSSSSDGVGTELKTPRRSGKDKSLGKNTGSNSLPAALPSQQSNATIEIADPSTANLRRRPSMVARNLPPYTSTDNLLAFDDKSPSSPSTPLTERSKSSKQKSLNRTTSQPSINPLVSLSSSSSILNFSQMSPSPASPSVSSSQGSTSNSTNASGGTLPSPHSAVNYASLTLEQRWQYAVDTIATKGNIRSIRVSHCKREQSHDDDPMQYFDFEWELSMNFGALLTDLLSVSVEIIDLNMASSVSKKRRDEIIKSLQIYTSEEFPYRLLLKLSPLKISLHKEIPLLLKNLAVFDSHSQILFDGHGTNSSLYTALLVLAERFQELGNMTKTIEAKCPNMMQAKTESEKALKALLISLDEACPRSMKMLKMITKDVITIGSIKLRDTLDSEVREIKNQKGTWSTNIEFGVNNQLSVGHQLRSTCVLTNLSTKAELDLVWGVVLTFNSSTMSLLTSSLNIFEFSFSSDVPPDRKQRVLDRLNPFKTRDIIESSSVSIPVSTVLQCISVALSRLPEESLSVTHSYLQHPVSAKSLLELLELKLSTEDLSPLLVQIRKAEN